MSDCRLQKYPEETSLKVFSPEFRHHNECRLGRLLESGRRQCPPQPSRRCTEVSAALKGCATVELSPVAALSCPCLPRRCCNPSPALTLHRTLLFPDKASVRAAPPGRGGHRLTAVRLPGHTGQTSDSWAGGRREADKSGPVRAPPPLCFQTSPDSH